MVVAVKVGSVPEANVPDVKVTIRDIDATVLIKKDLYPVSFKIRKSLEGNLMIFDHRDLDIVIMPQQKKIVAFPKDKMGTQVYDAQDRMFRFLHKMGVIKYGTVQGGAVYNSMQANLPTTDEYNVVDYVLFALEKWMDDEKPYFEFEEAFYDRFEKELTAPDEEDSTNFDPKRQAAEKGSIRPGMQPYGLTALYRL
jgi:hypothetical protein